MGKGFRCWTALIMAGILLIPAAGARTAAATEGSAESKKETSAESAQDSAKVDRTVSKGKVRSFLTGEMVDKAFGLRRPIAIQINDAKAATPCNGLNSAGIIYETPMEAGEVRFTAIMEDYADLERIGSVRSARTYHPQIACEYDAIFVHFGRSKYVVDDLSDPHIDDIDGVTGRGYSMFWRSKDRKAPHNAFTDSAHIDKKCAALGIDRDYDKTYGGKWYFAEDDDPVVLKGGEDAQKVSIPYPANSPWFEYNAEDQLYYRYQYGDKQTDELDGKQTTCRNIVVQYCDYDIQPDNKTKNIHLEGEGSGLYITGGKAEKISWGKPEKWGQTTYKDENGDEIVLNQGRTWVCLVLPSMTGEVILNDQQPETEAAES